MRNALTYRQAIEQAQAKVNHASAALEAAKAEQFAIITEALESGASFRDLGRQLGVSATTVMRRYGAKGRLDDHVDGLDLPVGAGRPTGGGLGAASAARTKSSDLPLPRKQGPA